MRTSMNILHSYFHIVKIIIVFTAHSHVLFGVIVSSGTAVKHYDYAFTLHLIIRPYCIFFINHKSHFILIIIVIKVQWLLWCDVIMQDFDSNFNTTTTTQVIKHQWITTTTHTLMIKYVWVCRASIVYRLIVVTGSTIAIIVGFALWT